jgi:hypothetical protein
MMEQGAFRIGQRKSAAAHHGIGHGGAALEIVLDESVGAAPGETR